LLYERHWNAVYRFAWLLTSSVPDAEDIAQECFLTLIRKSAGFDPSRAQLRTWLIAIARNQHLQRRRKLCREASHADCESSGVPTGLEEELIRLERAQAVRRALQMLPQLQREALYLFEFEGLSLNDVALVLEIDPTAVKATATEHVTDCAACWSHYGQRGPARSEDDMDDDRDPELEWVRTTWDAPAPSRGHDRRALAAFRREFAAAPPWRRWLAIRVPLPAAVAAVIGACILALSIAPYFRGPARRASAGPQTTLGVRYQLVSQPRFIVISQGEHP
jgi:RNA polymerase sigma-70 factor (ECF subfamily)